MPEKTELAPIEQEHEQLLTPVATADELLVAMMRFEAIKAALLVKDRDTYTVQGVERIRKSGWRKLALAFNLSDEVVESTYQANEALPGSWIYRLRVRVTSRGGRSVEGVGAASTTERPFANPAHDCFALAHTRAKSRAIADMLGSSDLVAEELEEPEQPAPKAPTPTPPSSAAKPLGTQQRVDGGQRAIVVNFLGEVLGDDLVDLVKLEEKDGELLVVLENPIAEANRTRFLKGMMSWGQGVHETSRGLIARMVKPKD